MDRRLLAADLDAIRETDLKPCSGYAVGRWSLAEVWTSEALRGNRSAPLGERLPYVMRRLEETFRFECVDYVMLFAAAPRSFLRPHRDWHAGDTHATRLHVPLRTDSRSLNSEGDAVYHMDVGEIWYVDPSRVHTGGTLSTTLTRLHVGVDLRAGVPIPDAFREPARYRPEWPRANVARPAFTEFDRQAILALGQVCSEANLQLVLDLLSTIHFERAVDCAEVYEWLGEIARRSGEPRLIEEVRVLRERFLLTAEEPVPASLRP